MVKRAGRMSDPLWVRCCELWERLRPYQRYVVVQAMIYFAFCMNDESPDEDAPHPEEAKAAGPDSQPEL